MNMKDKYLVFRFAGGERFEPCYNPYQIMYHRWKAWKNKEKILILDGNNSPIKKKYSEKGISKFIIKN